MSSFLACLGTRAEIVKLAPVCHALRAQGHLVHVLHTGEPDTETEALYRFFELPPDSHLQHSARAPTRYHMSAELLAGVDQQAQALGPDALLVQGDTASALVGALVGFYQDLPVAHIEAGLHSGPPAPWAQGKNRELIGRLARWHFPPSPQALRHLLREGVAARHIHAVGNTVVDATEWTCERLQRCCLRELMPPEVFRFLQRHEHRQLLLVTAQRREHRGLPMQRIAAAVAGLLQLHRGLTVLWPLPPEPLLRADIERALGPQAATDRERLCLSAPLDYPALVALLQACQFALTDASGTEQTASALRKPVLVLREHTDHPELVEAGDACLVGTQPHQIIEQASDWLRQPALLQTVRRAPCPYGDGHAAQRMAEVLCGKSPMKAAALSASA